MACACLCVCARARVCLCVSVCMNVLRVQLGQSKNLGRAQSGLTWVCTAETFVHTRTEPDPDLPRELPRSEPG